MKTLNGITLKYKGVKRNNYMSLSDISQDLTTDSLIYVLKTQKTLKSQMVIMKEIEKRCELSDDLYFDLLEGCNGI